MIKNLQILVLSLLVFGTASFAQVGQGSLKGKVIDKTTGEAIPFAAVVLKQNGSMVTGAQTDFDGVYLIQPISPGTYDLEITNLGYKPIRIEGMKITADKITFYDVNLEATAIAMKEVQIVEYVVPLIDKDGGPQGGTVTSEDITKMAPRSPAELAATIGGTYSKDDGSDALNIRGSRSDANYYFIDGIKVRGSTAIPKSSIEQISVLTGGLPAQYGDITGGVINITTKGASSEFHGGVEYLGSGIKFNDNTYVGLDPYGYNLLEGSLSGPIYRKRDSLGEKGSAVLGFFVSGNLTSEVDPRPSAVGAWKVRDDVLDDLKANPYRPGFTGVNSVQLNAEYLRLNDLELVPRRPNVSSRGANLAGKIDVSSSENTDLTFGGTFNYNNGKHYDYDHSLFDYENRPDRLDQDWRAYARFTQRFSSNEESSSNIKNAYYSVQADYGREYTRIQSARHEDRFFDYGYVGKFQTFQQRAYEMSTDSLTGIPGMVQTTFEDTLIAFTPGDVNPELTALTERYYEIFGWEGFDEEGNPRYDRLLAGEQLRNYNNIQQGGGMINGDNVYDQGSIYGMWAYYGDVANDVGGRTDQYLETITNQFRVTATGSANIKNHSLLVGLEYEQRIDRSYSVAPRRLWTLARLNANTHISDLDLENPQIIYPGPRIEYERKNTAPGEYRGDDSQAFIDYNLRKALGMNPDSNEYLDVLAIDPEVFKMEYFSADELYNNGNGSVVSYYGFDAYGNIQNENPSFDDFFTATDEYGNYTRPIAAFQPIYVAGYIQDKFAVDDLIFNIGLRVDQYDANQQVLKDRYVLFPTVRAGELNSSNDLFPEGVNVPANIGDDYVVYVNDVANPTQVLGYRDGRTWYNAEGAELTDASSLRISTGLPAPLLVDRTKTRSIDITSESFEDYRPQTNFMPRIAFSFPISDEANFFAHYDVLTSRPSAAVNRLDPSDYYFLQARTSAILNNPDLKPQKTIDYEVGFQQILNTSSSLKISAFYKELRDMVQVIYVPDAFPRQYQTFDNLDYGTVKGTTITYDLRESNNLTIRASYTLQFAEGTGSDDQSQLNLARTGQESLRAPFPLSYDQRHQFVTTVDYRYGSGVDYNGPMIKDIQILANTGANLILRGGSGTPYTPQENVTSRALFSETPTPTLEGSIGAARLPWKFRFDLRVDRSFDLNFGTEKKRTYNMNVYIQVLNLLNAQNIDNVYRYTGNPDDDGYVYSAQGLQYAQERLSPQSFQELYTVKLWNPDNWELPRRIRLGILLNF